LPHLNKFISQIKKNECLAAVIPPPAPTATTIIHTEDGFVVGPGMLPAYPLSR